MYGPRIQTGDDLLLSVASSVAVGVAAFAHFVDSSGMGYSLRVPLTTTGSARTTQNLPSSGQSPTTGEIVSAYVGHDGTPRRGQTPANLQLRRGGNIIAELCKGYIYKARGLSLGQHEELLAHGGHLAWVQEGNDIAGNVATTINLAATSTRRLVRGLVLKYHQTGGGAINVTVTLRDLADSGGPTNWSIASDTWVSPTLALGANEEGLIHIGEHGFVATNDAGTLAYADSSSAPNPFPLAVEPGDTVDLIVSGGGASGDDYDVWVLYEDWVMG